MKFLTAFVPAFSLLVMAPVVRADLLDVRMFVAQNYTQTSATPTFNFDQLEMDVIAQSSSVVYTSASVTYPGPGSPVTLTQSPTDPTFFNQYSPTYASLSALHSAFPFGAYTTTFTNGVTTSSATINYTADHFQTSVPALTATSLAAVLAWNTSQNVTLNFSDFTPDPATNDSVGTYVTIFASDGSTPFTTFIAAGDPTTVTVPVGTLDAGENYSLEISQGGRISEPANADGVVTELGFAINDTVNFSTDAPEPASLWLTGFGLIGVSLLRRTVFRRRG